MRRCAMHWRTCPRCLEASRPHTESAARAARASAQPYPTRQRATSPEGSSAHDCTSLLCFAASARHPESAATCARLSCCRWNASAAVSASDRFHLYCSTRHWAAPFASMVMALHAPTSLAALAADLPQASTASVTVAAHHAFIQRILASWVSGIRPCRRDFRGTHPIAYGRDDHGDHEAHELGRRLDPHACSGALRPVEHLDVPQRHTEDEQAEVRGALGEREAARVLRSAQRHHADEAAEQVVAIA